METSETIMWGVVYCLIRSRKDESGGANVANPPIFKLQGYQYELRPRIWPRGVQKKCRVGTSESTYFCELSQRAKFGEVDFWNPEGPLLSINQKLRKNFKNFEKNYFAPIALKCCKTSRKHQKSSFGGLYRSFR